MRIETLSVFPSMFSEVMSTSILGRARARNIFEYVGHDLRDYTHDLHRSVDDVPYGGGQGMLMMPGPIFEALDDISAQDDRRPYTIVLSPIGTTFDQKAAERLADQDRLLFVCGRYEGFDERIYTRADEILSLGDFILSGGELAAMVMIDAVVRLLPGALGDEKSAVDESFSDGLLEHAQYTRPAVIDGLEVPEILRSGNHGAIAVWRRRSQLERTHKFRPDLLDDADLTEEEKDYLKTLE